MEKILRIEQLGGENEGYRVVTDKQTIELGISADQDCCEQSGFFWSNDNPEEFIGAEVSSVQVVDTELNKKKVEDIGGLDAGGIMFINIDTDKGVLQFTAYNAHNGYYGHTAYVKSDQLKTEKTL